MGSERCSQEVEASTPWWVQKCHAHLQRSSPSRLTSSISASCFWFPRLVASMSYSTRYHMHVNLGRRKLAPAHLSSLSPRTLALFYRASYARRMTWEVPLRLRTAWATCPLPRTCSSIAGTLSTSSPLSPYALRRIRIFHL